MSPLSRPQHCKPREQYKGLEAEGSLGRKEITYLLRQPVAGVKAVCVFVPEKLLLRNAELPAL